MRFQTTESTLLQTLRGEEQVDAHRTAQSADRHEQIDELGLGAQEFRELVEHEEECGQRRMMMLACESRGFVVGDVGVVASLPEQLLSAYHFPSNRVLHAIDEGQLGFEVRNHCRDVRQI